MVKIILTALVAALAGLGGGAAWGMQRAEAARAEERARADKLQADLEARQRGERDQESRVRAAEAELQRLRGELAGATEAAKKTVADLDRAAAQGKDLLARANGLEGQLAQQKADATAAIGSIQAAAQARIDAAHVELGKAQASLQLFAQQSEAAAKAEIDRLGNLVKDRDKIVGSLQAQANELPVVRSQLDGARAEAADWKGRCEAANARATELEGKIDALTKELELLRKGGLKGILGGG